MSNYNKKYQANFDSALLAITLDRRQRTALHKQLTDTVRTLILSDRNTSGLRLPPSRTLADDLSVSRMTVTTAYDQLLSEGYLMARKGAGTFVATDLPHLSPPQKQRSFQRSMPQDWLPFQPGLPDQALFPHRHWAKCLDQAWRAPDQALLARPDHFGWFPLRQVISDHLSAWRGLDSGPHQILITSGAWEGFEIICEALLPSDRPVAMEDPGWSPLRQILKRSQKPPHPIRVDDHGLNVGLIPPKAQAVVVTPSRHFPTGQSMPLARRAALLNWADTHRGLIVEDDYDSEFRYQGQPLPSLSGLDGLQNTVYLGSFSKLLSPVLRLGYLVIPERFIPKVQAYIMARGAQASLVPQPALAMFMENGTFATHLRRMRRVYAKRQRVLLTALADVADLIDLQPDPSGMHLCCPLKPALTQVVTDAEISKAAQDHNLMVRALSSHSVLAKPPQGLLLGYAAFDTDMLTAAARTLADVLRTYRPFASPTF